MISELYYSPCIVAGAPCVDVWCDLVDPLRTYSYLLEDIPRELFNSRVVTQWIKSVPNGSWEDAKGWTRWGRLYCEELLKHVSST